MKFDLYNETVDSYKRTKLSAKNVKKIGAFEFDFYTEMTLLSSDPYTETPLYLHDVTFDA